jgi:hypothetical protein
MDIIYLILLLYLIGSFIATGMTHAIMTIEDTLKCLNEGDRIRGIAGSFLGSWYVVGLWLGSGIAELENISKQAEE